MAHRVSHFQLHLHPWSIQLETNLGYGAAKVMKELVTIQVGSYANFIGSHFWNFQDELLGLADNVQSDEIFRNHSLNMDVIYRTGETHQGILTYTPRLVSVGFQGSLGSVSAQGTLYNEVSTTSVDPLTWTGNVSTQASEPLKKNLFLQSLCLEEDEDLGTSDNGDSSGEVQDKDIVDFLENEVNYWTDYSKVHYHPQSLYELSGLWMDHQDFNNYGIGKDSFSKGSHGEEINDRLRFFVEECDLIQGIQLMVDDSGGFSAVAEEFLENIADEYPNIPLLLYSVREPASTESKSRKQTVLSNLHDAVSFSRLSAHCKLIVPVGLPSLSTSRMSRYLQVKDQKPYHTSAVYASAIHSITLPFRMEPVGPTTQSSYTCGAVNVNGLVQMLAGQARQNMVTVLDAAMPALAYIGFQAQGGLLENFRSLTPDIAEDVEDMQAVESMVVHGAYGSGSKRASINEVQEAVQAAYKNAVERPRFSHLSVARCPLPIPLPFPSIFGNLVGQNGELLLAPIPGSVPRGSLEVRSIPMSARMRSSNAVLPFLGNRLENLRKFGIARGALGTELLTSWGFEKIEVEEMGEMMSDMIKKLIPEHELSSDSD